MSGRALIMDENTGMLISVPAEKLEQKSTTKTPEQEAKAKENFDKAWAMLTEEIYGK